MDSKTFLQMPFSLSLIPTQFAIFIVYKLHSFFFHVLFSYSIEDNVSKHFNFKFFMSMTFSCKRAMTER